MIVKSLTWKVCGFSYLVDYVGRDLIDYVAREGEQRHDILHNLRHTGNLGDIARQFAEQDAYRKRRKGGVAMYHEILSFHPGDRAMITPAMLEDITREYLRLRAPRALAYAAPHFDRDHVHIHIAISGTEFRSSKTLRMDKRTFNRVKRQIQEYQRRKYPELEHSLVHFSNRGPSKEQKTPIEQEQPTAQEIHGHAQHRDEADSHALLARDDPSPSLPLTTRRFFSNLDLSRMKEDELRRKVQALEKLRDSRAAIGLRPHRGLDHLMEDVEHLGRIVGRDVYQRRLEELEVIQEARAFRDRAHEIPVLRDMEEIDSQKMEPPREPELGGSEVDQKEASRIRDLEQIQEDQCRRTQQSRGRGVE